jgi:hypothetical protein
MLNSRLLRLLNADAAGKYQSKIFLTKDFPEITDFSNISNFLKKIAVFVSKGEHKGFQIVNKCFQPVRIRS